MKISLPKTELEKCLKLIEVKELNICAAENYIDFLSYHARDIKSAFSENEWFNKFNSIMNVESKILKNSKMNEITKLNENDFLINPYYKTIGQIKAKNKEWEFMTLDYAPYEGFVSDEIVIDNEFYSEHTPISYFDKQFNFLAVLQDDEIWMSIMPHEINTMKKPIENAKGNVLVLGLGLGYYVFNILSRKEVKTVTVIENDKKIISLFNDYLIDKFPNTHKLKIIYGDAIEYVKNAPNIYDYCFADIWHNVGDGEILYLEIKNKEKYHSNTVFDYWIETSILAMLRRQTLAVFEEQLNDSQEEDYLNAYNDNDIIINKIYFYLKDKEIKTFNDLHEILSDKSLKVMATKLL